MKPSIIQAAWLFVRALKIGADSVEMTVWENIVYTPCQTAGREAYQMDIDFW